MKHTSQEVTNKLVQGILQTNDMTALKRELLNRHCSGESKEHLHEFLNVIMLVLYEQDAHQKDIAIFTQNYMKLIRFIETLDLIPSQELINDLPKKKSLRAKLKNIFGKE